MENFFSTEVILAIVSAVVGGIAWITKYILNKRDENQKRVFEERDKDKAQIKEEIQELKTEVKQTSRELKQMEALIVGCEHEDCPNRARLKEYLLNKD